jgi:chromosome segregation ATPase
MSWNKQGSHKYSPVQRQIRINKPIDTTTYDITNSSGHTVLYESNNIDYVKNSLLHIQSEHNNLRTGIQMLASQTSEINSVKNEYNNLYEHVKSLSDFPSEMNTVKNNIEQINTQHNAHIVDIKNNIDSIQNEQSKLKAELISIQSNMIELVTNINNTNNAYIENIFHEKIQTIKEQLSLLDSNIMSINDNIKTLNDNSVVNDKIKNIETSVINQFNINTEVDDSIKELSDQLSDQKETTEQIIQRLCVLESK